MQARIPEGDIIFMPYNYLLDSNYRKNLNINISNAVVIVDEAHNIKGTAEDMSSFDIGAGELLGCLREIGEDEDGNRQSMDSSTLS